MYAETAQALGLSEGAVKLAVHGMRKRFRQLLSEEIADTVSSLDHVDDEIQHLRSIVGS